MHCFTDTAGMEWEVSLTLGAAERIEQADFSLLTDKKISLLNLNEETIEVIFTNTGLLFALIWCCVINQADKHGIDQDTFKDRIDGEVLVKGKEAFYEEFVNFFPQQKTILLRMIDSQNRLAEKLNEMSPELQDKLETTVFKKVEQELQTLLDGMKST